MADDTNIISLIRTKLYRPPIYDDHLNRQHLLDRLDQRRRRSLTLVVAPAGYGKTSLVSAWLQASGSASAWVSLDKNDNDLRLFLCYFIAALQNIFPDAVRKTLAMVNASTLPPMSVLAGSLINELDRIEHPFILALDDYHFIKDASVGDLITQLLNHPPKSMHLVLISRRDPPLPISTLRAKGLLTEIRTQNLRFNKKETTAYLESVFGTQVDSSVVDSLDKKSEGWVTGLRLAALSMQHRGNIDPELIESQAAAQYVMEYLFMEVFSQKPPEVRQYLLGAAIVDRFCGPLCEMLCISGFDSSACEMSGWDFIAWLKSENIFLIPLDAENRWFRFHHLFQKLLLNQLQRHFSSEDIKALHAQASAWFAENGLIEEAIKHALAGDNAMAAARLVTHHGFNLVSEEQWPTLERWLRLIPEDIVYQDPELLILTAWTHVVFSRPAKLMSCLNLAETLVSDIFDSPAATKRILSHLHAMKGFQEYLTAEGERALSYAERAVENIPREHRWPRIFVSMLRVVAYQMTGGSEKARSIIEEMIQDENLRGGISKGYLLAAPCFFYWMEADLTNMLQTAARSNKIDPNLQSPEASGHGLYFSGIVYYHRNELSAAEEKLLPLVKSPYLHHAWNFAHSAFALALIHKERGRMNKAIEVVESVISYAIDTKNTAALNIARAFQAELALRQGRIAEASLWAEQFTAKPFTPMYRFYVPQLTLVKVLLAQDTTDSREQAEDLIRQLYDFVVSTHNTRFQIDVLALRALLYHSQGDEPSALTALSEALALAEPGGFIRIFVDLGPQMADLLNQLIKQDVAVEYIGRILAAIGEDEHSALTNASEQSETRPVQRSVQSEAESSRLSHEASKVKRDSSPYHPQVEPLTNRELDVLNLLAKRLSNSEIAETLFISTTTVKGHLQNIYGKLDVKKRRQAVEKAKALGIIKQ